MSARFEAMNNAAVNPPKIKVPQTPGPLSEMSDDEHENLLDFLLTRIKSAHVNRSQRLTRYARIDKLISTWQKLSKDDAQRSAMEDNTGRNQALPMNLPILAAHLDDSVSFFSEVFAPIGRDVYALPASGNLSTAATELAKKMNRDTRARKYYKELSLAIRSAIKYNIMGIAVRWEAGGGQAELAEAGNRIESIDFYNYLYDTSINDVSKIATEAEWAARISHKNRTWIIKKGISGALQRIDILLDKQKQRNNQEKTSTFYKYPPNHVGLSQDGDDDRTGAQIGSNVNWESYGATLTSDTAAYIPGYEVIEMYCWLNPAEFNLVQVGDDRDSGGASGLDEEGDSYELWKFVLIDSSQVCFAERVVSKTTGDEEIPHYCAYMTQDDMKDAQRSQMEMLRPFQRFTSFLFNVIIAAARKNVWGLKGVDPSMFDMSKIESGDVAGVVQSKVPGRDVRTGLMTLDSSTGTQDAFNMVGTVLELMRSLYPSQALPAQIAGIDRAVKNQVAAVLQGVVRRLHMTAKLIDIDALNPVRVQSYRNLAMFDNEGLTGLTEEEVAKVLGSGISQLNRDAIVSDFKDLIFAIIQNQEMAATFDLAGMMNYLGQLMNSPANLGDFVKQQPTQAPVDPNANPAAAAAAATGVVPGM